MPCSVFSPAGVCACVCVRQLVHFTVYSIFESIIDSDQHQSSFTHFISSLHFGFSLSNWPLLHLSLPPGNCLVRLHTRYVYKISTPTLYSSIYFSGGGVVIVIVVDFLVRYFCCCCCSCCLSKTHSLFLFQLRLWTQSIFILSTVCVHCIQSLGFFLSFTIMAIAIYLSPIQFNWLLFDCVSVCLCVTRFWSYDVWAKWTKH